MHQTITKQFIKEFSLQPIPPEVTLLECMLGANESGQISLGQLSLKYPPCLLLQKFKCFNWSFYRWSVVRLTLCYSLWFYSILWRPFYVESMLSWYVLDKSYKRRRRQSWYVAQVKSNRWAAWVAPEKTWFDRWLHTVFTPSGHELSRRFWDSSAW